MCYRQLFFLLSLNAIALLGGGVSAQAETANTASSTPAPIPGAAATTADALSLRTAEPASETSASRVAQINVEPGQGVETPTIPTQPAQGVETPTDPTQPAQGVETPTDPTQPAPIQTTPAPTATVNFTDVDQGYWAYPFIQGLAGRNIIAGFPIAPLDRNNL